MDLDLTQDWNDISKYITEQITDQIDKIFLTGLELKGFKFNNRIEVIEFIEKECHAVCYQGETTYFIQSDPFLIHKQFDPMFDWTTEDRTLTCASVCGQFFYV